MLFACALVVFAQVNRIALKHKSPEQMLGAGLALHVAAGIGSVSAAAFGGMSGLVVALWFAIGALGLVGANTAALAMAASRTFPGTASSLVGVLQFGCAFLVSSLVAAAQNGTSYPMAVTIAACGALAAGLWFALRTAAPFQAGGER